jgi:hypothetical protein
MGISKVQEFDHGLIIMEAGAQAGLEYNQFKQGLIGIQFASL